MCAILSYLHLKATLNLLQSSEQILALLLKKIPKYPDEKEEKNIVDQ